MVFSSNPIDLKNDQNRSDIGASALRLLYEGKKSGEFDVLKFQQDLLALARSALEARAVMFGRILPQQDASDVLEIIASDEFPWSCLFNTLSDRAMLSSQRMSIEPFVIGAHAVQSKEVFIWNLSEHPNGSASDEDLSTLHACHTSPH